jgi:hypothetical protein
MQQGHLPPDLLAKLHQSNRRTLRVLYAMVWLAWLCVVSFLVWRAKVNADELHEFNANGIEAIATVSRTDCSNHGSVYYRWEWKGQAFSGRQRSCSVACKDLHAGMEEKIRFAPTVPGLMECASTPIASFSLLSYLQCQLLLAFLNDKPRNE